MFQLDDVSDRSTDANHDRERGHVRGERESAQCKSQGFQAPRGQRYITLGTPIWGGGRCKFLEKILVDFILLAGLGAF